MTHFSFFEKKYPIVLKSTKFTKFDNCHNNCQLLDLKIETLGLKTFKTFYN